MSYKVVIKTEARADVAVAYNFYEEKQAGLGEAFLEAFENRCNDLSQHPSHYSYLAEDPKSVLRDVKLHRFPYVVIFEIAGIEVVVYSVLCTYIDPENKLRKV